MSFPLMKGEAMRKWTRSLLPGTAVFSLLLTATTAVLVAAPDLSSMRARFILVMVLEVALTAAVVAAWRLGIPGLQTPGSSQGSTILRNIFEGSPDMIFVKDLTLRTVLCNSAFASALGRRAEELYGKTDVEIGWSTEMVKGNPEKGVQGWEMDDRAALEGRLVHARQEPVNIGEEIRFFDTVKLPLRSERGEIIGLLGMSRDITERIQLQKNLEQERALLLTLINSIPDLVYVKDLDCRFILANIATARYFGCSDVAKIIGRPTMSCFPATRPTFSWQRSGRSSSRASVSSTRKS